MKTAQKKVSQIYLDFKQNVQLITGGLSLKNIKLLNNKNDNNWFCSDCGKPALTAIFTDKEFEEKCQKRF